MRPRTTGASTWNRVPSGSSRMRSTICWGVCRVIWRAALGAVGHADAGVEQPQVVVDLGDRADRGARVAGRGLLVDRDGRRQALDEVDVGLVHLPEELPGVGRQRLDVAALALGVDRVERQRRLPRAREPREDDQLVAGQLDADVLQVVLARPATTSESDTGIRLAASRNCERMFARSARRVHDETAAPRRWSRAGLADVPGERRPGRVARAKVSAAWPSPSFDAGRGRTTIARRRRPEPAASSKRATASCGRAITAITTTGSAGRARPSSATNARGLSGAVSRRQVTSSRTAVTATPPASPTTATRADGEALALGDAGRRVPPPPATASGTSRGEVAPAPLEPATLGVLGGEHRRANAAHHGSRARAAAASTRRRTSRPRARGQGHEQPGHGRVASAQRHDQGRRRAPEPPTLRAVAAADGAATAASARTASPQERAAARRRSSPEPRGDGAPRPVDAPPPGPAVPASTVDSVDTPSRRTPLVHARAAQRRRRAATAPAATNHASAPPAVPNADDPGTAASAPANSRPSLRRRRRP